jgi:hypothetical protein
MLTRPAELKESHRLGSLGHVAKDVPDGLPATPNETSTQGSVMGFQPVSGFSSTE